MATWYGTAELHWEHFIVASIKQRKPFFFHFLNLESLFNISMLHWQLDCQTESQADPYVLRLIPHIFESEVLGPHLVATVSSLPNRRVYKDSFLLHLDRQKTPLNHVDSKGIWCRQTCPSSCTILILRRMQQEPKHDVEDHCCYAGKRI